LVAVIQEIADGADIAAIDALERGERLVSPDFAPQWD
jgi:2,5-diketo-D-gluconate reductase B